MNSALMSIPVIVSRWWFVDPIVWFIFIWMFISFICLFMKND